MKTSHSGYDMMHPEVEALIGAMQARRRHDVNRHAANLLGANIALGRRWAAIARALAHNGEVALSLVAAARAVTEAPSADVPAMQFGYAVLLAESGRHADARRTAMSIPHGAIDAAQLDHFIGTCAMETQDFEEAKARFDAVVARRPSAAPSWLSLVSIANSADLDRLWPALDAAAAHLGTSSPEDRGIWYYARGAAAHVRGDVDGAFADFAAGAALVAPLRPYDAAADRRQVDRLIEHPLPSVRSDWCVDRDAPIFVLGHPRSGTTLVERLLGGTGGAVPGGELNLMRIVADEAGGLLGPRAAGRENELRGLLDRLLAQRLGEGNRAIDKSLNNSRYLGLIMRIAPGAPIVRIRRSKVDAAWSCFRTYFSRGVPWSWSFDSIVAHFQAEERLFSAWEEQLGSQMLVVDYEDLVADPAVTAARLRTHCGLGEAPVTAATSAQPVRTASVAQVSRPITTAAVGAAEPYRAHLTALYDAFGA